MLELTAHLGKQAIWDVIPPQVQLPQVPQAPHPLAHLLHLSIRVPRCLTEAIVQRQVGQALGATPQPGSIPRTARAEVSRADQALQVGRSPQQVWQAPAHKNAHGLFQTQQLQGVQLLQPLPRAPLTIQTPYRGVSSACIDRAARELEEGVRAEQRCQMLVRCGGRAATCTTCASGLAQKLRCRCRIWVVKAA
jgi:hypothetical protein